MGKKQAVNSRFGDNQIPETFGGRLRDSRERAGLTQVDVANAIGLAVTAVSGWENDRRGPRDADTYLRLADALGVSVDYLLRGRPEADPMTWVVNEMRQLLDDAERLRRGGFAELGESLPPEGGAIEEFPDTAAKDRPA